jgi:hypothetical protein
MLNLLLDDHIPPDVAAGLRRRNAALLVRSMVKWEHGSFIGQEDSVSLQEAFVQCLTLVTYDRRTIPPLLKTWTEEAHSHAGVIFVDEKNDLSRRHWRAGQISRRASETNAHMGLDR